MSALWFDPGFTDHLIMHHNVQGGVLGIPQRNKCGRASGVVPKVCPRQTHSNSLQPTPANLETKLDCFQCTSRLSIEPNCIALSGGIVWSGRPLAITKSSKRSAKAAWAKSTVPPQSGNWNTGSAYLLRPRRSAHGR